MNISKSFYQGHLIFGDVVKLQTVRDLVMVVRMLCCLLRFIKYGWHFHECPCHTQLILFLSSILRRSQFTGSTHPFLYFFKDAKILRSGTKLLQRQQWKARVFGGENVERMTYLSAPLVTSWPFKNSSSFVSFSRIFSGNHFPTYLNLFGYVMALFDIVNSHILRIKLVWFTQKEGNALRFPFRKESAGRDFFVHIRVKRHTLLLTCT